VIRAGTGLVEFQTRFPEEYQNIKDAAGGKITRFCKENEDCGLSSSPGDEPLGAYFRCTQFDAEAVRAVVVGVPPPPPPPRTPRLQQKQELEGVNRKFLDNFACLLAKHGELTYNDLVSKHRAQFGDIRLSEVDMEKLLVVHPHIVKDLAVYRYLNAISLEKVLRVRSNGQNEPTGVIRKCLDYCSVLLRFFPFHTNVGKIHSAQFLEYFEQYHGLVMDMGGLRLQGLLTLHPDIEIVETHYCKHRLFTPPALPVTPPVTPIGANTQTNRRSFTPGRHSRTPAREFAATPPPTPTPTPRVREFNWSTCSGHKTIIIVGGTGHGKSTFVNSLSNFIKGNSINEMEVLIPTQFLQPRVLPGHTEQFTELTASTTQACTNYKFESPRNHSASITFIDTPGLGDTRGVEQDEINVKLILDAAETAQASGTLAGFIYVMKGTEVRQNHNMRHIANMLRSFIPDQVLKNLVGVFTYVELESQAARARDIAPFPMKHEFFLDNKAFSVNMAEVGPFDKPIFEFSWERSMIQVGRILATIFDPSFFTGTADFARLRNIRDSLKTKLHSIQTNIVKMENVLEMIETAEQQAEAAGNDALATSNFVSQKQVTHQQVVDDRKMNTLCQSCTYVCHDACGLEGLPAGDRGFTQCFAFRGDTHCRICPSRCSLKNHYHANKKVETVTQTVDEILESVKAQHLAANDRMQVAIGAGRTAAQRRAAVDAEIQSYIADIQTECTRIRGICSGFNLAEELTLTISDLKEKNIALQNVQAKRLGLSVIDSITRVVNAFETCLPVRAQAAAGGRRPRGGP